MQLTLTQEAKKTNKQINKILHYYVKNNDEIIFDDALDVCISYCPLKERSFLLKLIADGYDISFKRVETLALGVELSFISYYLKDDIIDNTKFRNGNETLPQKKGIGYALLIADLVLEIGHSLLLQYVTREKIVNNNLFQPYIKLVTGQLKAELVDQFENFQTINSMDIPTLKGGSVFESLTYNLQHLIADKSDYNKITLISKNIGTLLQIRNDIEDFLSDPSLTHQTPLSDLTTGKFNYVLSEFCKINSTGTPEFEQLKKYWNLHLPCPEKVQDEIYELLEKRSTILTTLNDLFKKITEIESLIKSLNNKKIINNLITYTNIITKPI
jgi:geranylgeranyl pyrophosphate synthase